MHRSSHGAELKKTEAPFLFSVFLFFILPLWPSHAGLPPALTSRRSGGNNRAAAAAENSLRQQQRWPCQGRRSSGAEKHRQTAATKRRVTCDSPQKERSRGEESLRFQPSERIGLFTRRGGRNGNLFATLRLLLLLLFLKSASLSFHSFYFPLTGPPPQTVNPLYFNLTGAEREIEPCDWVARFSIPSVCSNLKYVLAALPLSHVGAEVGEVKMRIVRWFCIIYSARPLAAPLVACMRNGGGVASAF